MALGVGSTEFVLNLSDEDIPGAQSQNLRLIVTYDVVAAIALLGDVNLDGVVDFFDIAHLFRSCPQVSRPKQISIKMES